MLNVKGDDRFKYCDGLNRRSFLQAGFLGVAGLTLGDALRLKAQAREAGQPTRNTAVILLWLDGGPTHMDTYDLKPDAPKEYRGPFNPIATDVAGTQICELLPRQAQVMKHLSVCRSLYHTTGDHFAGAHWMLTGYLGSNSANREQMYPSAGAITAKLRGANRSGLPAFVSVPYASTVGLRPGYLGGAYLGSSYHPFQTGSDPNRRNFSVKNLTLPSGVSMSQLEDRKQLLRTFDGFQRDVDHSGTAVSMDKFQREAYEMISGPVARRAFDINAEDPRTRDRYGRNNWGQSTLLARRLVEAGVTFVSVHMGGWDNHSKIEDAMKRHLPRLDAAVASLVEDLVDRGMHDDVAVWICGEFGRTPKVNGNAGRDHWGRSGFFVLGGGGVHNGQVVGSTTSKGERPHDSACRPEDMVATVYKILGIDTSITFHDASGRPHPVVKGSPISQLI